MKRSNSSISFAAALFGLLASTPGLSAAVVVYSDDFNFSVTSANYDTVTTDATSSFATFAYDYSVMGIPSAPNTSDGSTKGLRLDANFSAPNAAEAITLYKKGIHTGDYSVKFDAWLNVNGPFPDGGSGSTNYLTAGVGGSNSVNNFVANTGFGGWTAVNGENGSGIDYRLYKDATLQGVASGQYAAGTAANARNGLNGYYDALGSVNVSNLPVQGANNGGPAQQNGTSFAGSFGMAWHEVELVVDDDGGTGGNTPLVKWFIDGLLIGSLDGGVDGNFASTGQVALGYSDPTANGSDNPPLSFALIDNLTICVPEPQTATLLGLAIISLGSRARRRQG